MTPTLSGIDIGIVVVYLAGIVGMSFAFARRQHDGEDYFLAGRQLRGFTLAISILANQASAVSLVGAPAFVALRDGGGLRWLQYELALPLAMLVLIILLLPALRSVPGSSIYAYAEQRFGRRTRQVLAASFLLSRGLSLGVILYASALVVSTALGWPVGWCIAALGLFSVAYTSLGGLAADVWSDVVQFILLWGGTLVAAIYVVLHGGMDVLHAIPLSRAKPLVLGATGFQDGTTFAFWPMLFGGMFLYLSYYGCDQSQAQRLLAARSDADARRALLWNGLLRFPLVLTYCVFGLLLAGLLRVDAGFAADMASRPADSLVPTFMMGYLPTGLRGLLLAAILAAAMSSIDSALNSLAAVTLEDVAGIPPARQPVWLSRGVSLGWGLFAVASGALFARTGSGVLETINLIGSAFYGPVLAVFLLGVLAPRLTGSAALVGLVVGLLGNLALARLAPGVSWLWWNPAGFFVTCVVALSISRVAPHAAVVRWPRREAAYLLGAFVVMLVLLAGASLSVG
ncbi:MAG TPA: sodium/solute symporter [Gemmatimonadaceae bacterium]|nr:sodium/solute symporter [Gemmatimonadaceae bacterium]